MAGLNVAQNVQSAAIGHVNVQQHQIPLVLAQLIQSLVAAGGLAYGIDARIRLQKLLEARSDHRMIVRDQYS